MSKSLILVEQIEPLILTIRGQKVLLDTDLASLYGVSAKRLNEQVKRNRKRFPDDFLFRLSAEAASALRSQFATLKLGRGQHRKYLPYAFTEHGAIMAANVLNSSRAIEVGLYVVRAFVKLRKILSAHEQLDQKLAELERKVGAHDEAIRQLVGAIRKLMAPSAETRKGKIGFGRENES